ncbi:hypothetical protein T4E_4212, partial [Trichinella pseudospiralis]
TCQLCYYGTTWSLLKKTTRHLSNFFSNSQNFRCSTKCNLFFLLSQILTYNILLQITIYLIMIMINIVIIKVTELL